MGKRWVQLCTPEQLSQLTFLPLDTSQQIKRIQQSSYSYLIELQVKAILKTYSFLSPENKKVYRFCMKISSITNTSVSVPFTYSFSKNISTTKPVSTICSVDYPLSPSGLTSRIHPLIFRQPPQDFISRLHNICWIFFQTCMFYIYKAKIESTHFLLMLSQETLPPPRQIFSSPPGMQ